MKINGNEIKPGNIIQHNDAIWVSVKTSHVKPGKGGAFAQVELKKIPECQEIFVPVKNLIFSR